MVHTILLIQPSVTKPESRTWSDYDDFPQCLDGICKVYEEYLKRKFPNQAMITYDINQLYNFIEQLADISLLIFDHRTDTYVPKQKEWIKEQIYVHLRKQAGS